MSLSGKVALVTGAGSGIGKATALLFSSEGALVALVDLNESRLSSVAQQCSAHGKSPLIIKADITNEVQAKDTITKTVKHFGKLDILVNNAGIYAKRQITDPDYLDNFDSMMQTNVRSVAMLTNLAAPHLKATKGNIVNVCSVTSTWVGISNSSYCVSKAAVEHFTRNAALEFAEFGVRVNCVSPGPVRTNILNKVAEDLNVTVEEYFEELKQTTALRRVSEPEEIADVILFLASEKGICITSSTFVCDNGFLIAGNKIDYLK